LANNFSTEVSHFIDGSSEETTSSPSSSESDESSSQQSLSESYNLFLAIEDLASFSNLHLPLSFDAIPWRRESLERERVIGWMRERVNDALAFIATVGGIFEETPR
jgi:hypothetical protein